ncbi:MAG: 3-ketoacyl-ACP reductase FabG2 [Spirochaetales bacterium]|nr:3-ketoacyl-ACP reductase FabG2 [Spirochaetales bacterium]
MSRRVLVTGASKGIGRAIAIEAAKGGFDVSVHYNRDKAGAEQTAAAVEELGQSASILSFDIADRELCKEVLEKEVEEYGVFYGVVCNAGITRDNAFPSITSEDWDKVLHTNLDGFYNVVHPLVMPMVRARKPGRIIALSSVSGIIGNRGQVNYSASKAGIIGATKALAVELGKRNITVNCIAPGVIETEMVEEVPWDHIKASVPLRRMGKPEEVGALAAFLLSDSAAYITRQVISVNGGMV